MGESGTTAIFGTPPGSWSSLASAEKGDAGGLDAQHLLVLEYTDAITLDVHVPDELMTRMKASFNEKEIVEITTTIGCYNCVSRFLVALDVAESNGDEGMKAAIAHSGGVKEGTVPAPRTSK